MEKVKQFVETQVLDPSALFGAIFYAAVFVTAAWALGWLLKNSVTRDGTRSPRSGSSYGNSLCSATTASVDVHDGLLCIRAPGSGTSRIGRALRQEPAWYPSSLVWLRNTLGNLIAGMTLLLYRPFQVGDRVQAIAPTGLETGVVEVITPSGTQSPDPCRSHLGRKCQDSLVLPESSLGWKCVRPTPTATWRLSAIPETERWR